MIYLSYKLKWTQLLIYYKYHFTFKIYKIYLLLFIGDKTGLLFAVLFVFYVNLDV